MLTIAVLNQKGGVGKTTTVANLGAAVAARGCRLCLIDLDPQAHLTLHFNAEPSAERPTIYDVLSGGGSLASAAVRLDERLSLVPSVIDLAGAEVELAAIVGREQILRDALAAEPMGADLVLIDCPPSLGLLTLNALAASDEVLIPLQPHFLALHGLGKLLETVQLVQRRINPALRVGGVVLCMYEKGTRLAAEVVDDLRSFFGAAQGAHVPWGQARIYRTIIRRNVKLAECPSHGKTIFQYDPSSRGAEDYGALADEFAAFYPQLFPTPPLPAKEEPVATEAQRAQREADCGLRIADCGLAKPAVDATEPGAEATGPSREAVQESPPPAPAAASGSSLCTPWTPRCDPAAPPDHRPGTPQGPQE